MTYTIIRVVTAQTREMTKVETTMAEYQNYQEWQTAMAKVTLPAWDDLPKFDLYMDQVLEFVNDALKPLELDTVTATMVNNYVKKKVVLAPNKKKYSIMQVADIVLLTMLKSVFSLDLIRAGMNQITMGMYPKQAYDYFTGEIVKRLQNIGEVPTTPQNTDSALALIDATIEAMISKLNAEKILEFASTAKAPKTISEIK